jgi:putative aminopeptidase FrvX
MKDIVTQNSLAFLDSYINNAAPTSFESAGQKMWLKYIEPYIDEWFLDDYGTAVGVINPGKDYKVVIEAHADEISWYVNYITKEGLIYVIRNGGSDHQIAPSKKVLLHGSKGAVRGVFGWPAIHTRAGEKEEAPTLKNIFIDCGCTSKEEVLALGIDVGTVITYADTFEVLNDRYYMGRALDNRIGGFMIAEVARLLKENKKELPYTLYVVNAVQEEIGLRGAEMIARRLKPNVAICTDVTHDTTTPMINKNTQGDMRCGGGPVSAYGPAVQMNLLKLLLDTAAANNITVQKNACSRSTGTDTDAFAYSNDGTPSALISLPLRYMHTTVEMVHKDDVNNVISLIYNTLLNIKAHHSFKYFDTL